MSHVKNASEALDFIPLEDMESIVRHHLPPGVFCLALRWLRGSADWDVEQFINALVAHDPELAGLCAHVLADLRSVEGLCPPARARAKGGAAADPAA
jgi:hypothetical protein